jgi:hypothetical protein
MGSPEYLSAAQVAQLLAASVCDRVPQPYRQETDATVIELTLPPFAVAAVQLSTPH